MNEPKHNFKVGDIVLREGIIKPYIITRINKLSNLYTLHGYIIHDPAGIDISGDKLSYPKGGIEPVYVTVAELKSGRTPFLIPGMVFHTQLTSLVLTSGDPLEFRLDDGSIVELSDNTKLIVSTGGIVNIPEPKAKRSKNMKFEELNKNNKYTYRRTAWNDFGSDYLTYNPKMQAWMVSINSTHMEPVGGLNKEANDWYETNEPNPHYIEEPQVSPKTLLRFEELNKNNKFYYSRQAWGSIHKLAAYSREVNDWVYYTAVGHCTLSEGHRKANDWYETNEMSPHYTEEVQVHIAEPDNIIIPTPWKNPKPNVAPSRRPTAGQWVVRDSETPGIIESQQLQTPTPVYPLFEQKQKAIKTGMFVELNQTIAGTDTLYIVKRKIKDQIELVCGTMVKMEDVMRYYDFKPEEVSYDIYSCGTVVTESSEVFDSLEELTESYGSGTKLKVRSEHAVGYEYLQISEYFNVPIDTLKPKDEGILDEIKTALDHPINVADKEWVLLVGKSGSGKTEAAVAYAKSVGKEYIKLQGSAQVTVDDLIGYNSITTGEYFPSLLRDAVENGKVFILDEIDACNPNTLLVLNGLKQEYFQFPDKLVKIHPEFRFIATANTLEYSEEYLGRSPMDKATLARFYTINYEMAPVDLAIRYGLNNIKKIEGVDRLTPREIAREVRKIRIEELNPSEDTLKKKK